MRLAQLATMAGVGLMVVCAGAAQTLAPDVAKKVDAVFTKWDRPDSPGCAPGVYRGRADCLQARVGMEGLAKYPFVLDI